MVRPGDIRFLHTLGHGAFSKVELAEHVTTGVKYAVKVVSKRQIERDKRLMEVAKRERDILSKCHHPNIVRLVSTYQTADDLCYVMEYCGGGELLEYIKKVGRFQTRVAVFIAAEIVLALEYLHTEIKAIHRDIKPENILLDANSHVKLIDFGTAVLLSDLEKDMQDDSPLGVSPPEEGGDDITRARSPTFCGTTHYMPPEMLERNESSRSGDLWGLGCVVYYMLTGQRPFDDTSQYGLIQKVLEKDKMMEFPEDIPPAARAFILALLERDSKKRLGAEEMGGYAALKAHEFFSGVDFASLSTCELRYSWVPQAPVWVKDADVTVCRKCNDAFTFWNRKHHCRKCGHVFCDKCTAGRCAIPQYNFLKPVRVCGSCLHKLQNGLTDSPSSTQIKSSSQNQQPRQDPNVPLGCSL
jgi:serine/threonine protein kinase